jgi:single-strand DNA-binding protein
MSDMRLVRVNRVQLSGRVTRDLTLRYAPDGTPVVTFTVAFNRWVRGEGGRWQEIPGFIGVLASGRLAELAGERLHKGSALYLEGRLQDRHYRTSDGRTRSLIEIRAEHLQFLERELEAGEEPDDAPPFEGRHAAGRAGTEAEEGELFPEPGPEED